MKRCGSNVQASTKKRKETGDNSTNSTLLRLACRHFRSIHTYKGGQPTHETQVANQRQKDLNVHRSGLAQNRRIMKASNPPPKTITLTNKKNIIMPQIKNYYFTLFILLLYNYHNLVSNPFLLLPKVLYKVDP